LAVQIPGVSNPPSSSTTGVGIPTVSIPILEGTPKKASPLPLIVCVLLLVASLLIQLFSYQLGGGSWFFLGYLLTPVLTSLALGWDSVLQRNGRKDPWFAPSPLFSRLIRITVALSFVIGVLHILEIGRMCGQAFVQSGALCV
jgi:hypothetical protein